MIITATTDHSCVYVCGAPSSPSLLDSICVCISAGECVMVSVRSHETAPAPAFVRAPVVKERPAGVQKGDRRLKKSERKRGAAVAADAKCNGADVYKYLS